MSETDVEVVRSLMTPFQSINVAAVDWRADPIRELMGSTCAPEVELRTLESGIGTGVGEVYRGLDGLASYLHEWMEPFAEYRIEWIDYIDTGDFILVPSSQWGIGGGSGVRVDLDVVYACEVKDGLITRVLQYDTLEDAKRAIASGA
jgi:hypothetical protein